MLIPVQYQEFGQFFLILLRISIVLFMFPFFNSRAIPPLIKSGLVLVITIILFPSINSIVDGFPGTSLEMGLMVTSELIIGMILGLLIQTVFEGIRMMGHVVGFQTGFAIVNILDPQSGMQVSILSNIAYFVAIVLFLVLNGHHIVLNAIKESFDIINVGALSLDKRTFHEVIKAFGDMFVIAIKIGAPAIAALFLTKVAFGLVTKLIPQMNIMIVAMPVQIVIGLLFFGICLNALLGFMEIFLGDLDSILINTMDWMKA